MQGDVPESTSTDPSINNHSGTVICECGRELPIDETSAHATCECGAVYTVTITQIRKPTTEEPSAPSFE